MKTILLPDSTSHFSQTDPTGVIENDFEQAIIPMLGNLYPQCHVIPFKPIIYHESERWKPDLAIVDKEYNYWFVIEVEIATHSLQKHILGQVRAFVNGDYREEAAQALAENLNVSKSRAETFIKYIPRYVAVISNQDNETWTHALAKESAQHISISTYANQDGTAQATLVSGRLQTSRHSLGFGQVDATVPCIRLAKNEFWENSAYRITEKTGTATWNCFVTDKVIWLSKRRGTIQMEHLAFVQIIRDGDEIFLQEIKY